MSCTETHFGKFIVRAREIKDIKEYCDKYKIPYNDYNGSDKILN